MIKDRSILQLSETKMCCNQLKRPLTPMFEKITFNERCLQMEFVWDFSTNVILVDRSEFQLLEKTKPKYVFLHVNILRLSLHEVFDHFHPAKRQIFCNKCHLDETED